MSRLDRIEQRLVLLESGGAADAAPIAGGGVGAAGLQVELNAMREELRRLNGDIEELRHTQEMLKASFKRFEQDSDLRFEVLEQASAAAPVIGGEEDAPVIAAPVIGEMPAASEDESLGASELYQKAFEALNEGGYGEAEQLFLQFIASYGEHSLIGNAYYWLGETYYVQQQHENAAEQFRKGFQALPEGPKAPDNLLRLGMTLGVLERRNEACIIFKQLLGKYKGGSESVLRKAQRERDQLGCS